MKQMGLDRLRGPGAWMTYGQPPAVSVARTSQRGVEVPPPAAPGTKEQ
jgi:hypothetical protein